MSEAPWVRPTHRTSPIGRACKAGQVHPAMAARVAGSRFGPDPVAYRAATAPDAPTRLTRAEAIADECAHLCGPGNYQEGAP